MLESDAVGEGGILFSVPYCPKFPCSPTAMIDRVYEHIVRSFRKAKAVLLCEFVLVLVLVLQDDVRERCEHEHEREHAWAMGGATQYRQRVYRTSAFNLTMNVCVHPRNAHSRAPTATLLRILSTSTSRLDGDLYEKDSHAH